MLPIHEKNLCLSTGLLTGTGAETVYDTTVTINFVLNGVIRQKTAVTDGATPTTDGITGAAFNPVYPDKACLFVWCLNSNGTVSLIQGEIEDVDGTSDEIKAPLQFPGIPNDRVPFAYTKYQTTGASSASGLRPGTDNWNATGLTATHTNVCFLPSRPVE
jgi:hypothetical protein